MSYPETRIDKEGRRAALLAGRAPTPEASPPQSQSRKILEGHLDRLLAQLTGPESAVDTGRIQDMLVALAKDIRSRSSVFQSSDYRWILERLTEIYAQGCGRRGPEPLTITAAAYAQVIETISRAHPSCDYGEAIGQLFCYMSRLFQIQESSWKAVYEHILSIPDSIEAKQLLNHAFFIEIQEWAEAGVENLFSIRRDLYEKIGELTVEVDRLDRRIATTAGESNRGGRADTAVSAPNVIDFAKARKKHLVASMERRRQRLVDEKKNEESIVALIESDIREFEEKLRNTRRAYFIRPV